MVVKGKEVRDNIRSKIREKSDKENYSLHMLRVGENPSDISYERGIIGACKDTGIDYKTHVFNIDVTEDILLDKIEELNNNPNVDGIIIFRPLISHLNEYKIINAIDPNKDVDGSTDVNLSKIFQFKESIEPATARACIEFLKYNKIEIEGKNILIINRSMVLGRPLAMMLLKLNATVTIAHSKTVDLDSLIKSSDIIISATGKAKLHNRDIFNENQILIDVGMSEDEDGNLVGDFDIELLKDKVKIITPVLGGIGSITSSVILLNTILAKEMKGDKNGR